MGTTELLNKTCLITGAGSGIGLAAAKLFLKSGAAVVLNDIDATKEAFIVQLLIKENIPSAQMAFFAGDIANPATATLLMEFVQKRCGGLDILINNAATAGSSSPIPFADLDALTDDFWQHLMAVNLLAPFRLTKLATPALQQSKGCVINTASVAGLNGNASSIPYAASKAALINLTQNLARALAPKVRVNAVAPGWIDSPWTQTWSDERRNESIRKCLLGRLGQPEEIAEVMLFLATNATFINGQTLVVDGGR